MEIRLYTNYAKRRDSTAQPSATHQSKNVVLKNLTSVTNPVFLLTGYDSSKNYIYVPSWGRYYFVDDWKLVNGDTNLYEVDCALDGGATFKTEILNYTAFVERCADSRYYNVDLYDNLISSTEMVTSGAQASTELWGNGGVFCCRVINGDHGISTYIGGKDTFSGLFNPDINITTADEIVDAFKDFVYYEICAPSDYVLDTYYLGIPLAKLTPHCDGEYLASGWYRSESSAYRWNASTQLISDTISLNRPTRTYSDFRASAGAFSSYFIYIPSVGCMPLSGDIIDSPLKLKYAADIVTGDVFFMLYNTVGSTDTLISTYHGNVKSGFQTGGMTPTGSSILNSSANFAQAVVAGNPVNIGLSAYNVVQNVIAPTPSIAGSVGSCGSIMLENDIIISELVKQSTDIPLEYAGRPCNKTIQLSNLSGFVKCAGANVPLAGTARDKEIVNNLLNNGFYIE